MKKFAMTAVALILLAVTVAFGAAAENSYDAMSAEELQAELLKIHAALADKEINAESGKEIVAAEDFGGYRLHLGKTEWENGELTLWFTVINDSSYQVYLETYSSSVNGWRLGSSTVINQFDRGTTAPGERGKNIGKITLKKLEEFADVTKPEQINVMRIELSLFMTGASEQKRAYCAFYLISDGEGGFTVSSSKIRGEEAYQEVVTF